MPVVPSTAAPAAKEPLFVPKEFKEMDIPAMVEDAAEFIGNEIALNSLLSYAVAVGAAALGIGLIWLVKGAVAKLAARWLSSIDHSRVDHGMAREVGNTLAPLLYLFPLYFSLSMLRFSKPLLNAIGFLIMVLFTTRTVRFLSALASFATDTYLRGHQQSLNSIVGKALAPIIRVLFWTVGITIILDNIGVQISSLLAGLGIVGVAMGLASQAILGDFFGYLVIIMDRPFNIGDYISVGDVSGTIESIGLKTTRVRTIGGEVIVCPNGDITKQRISNFRLMYRRTRSFTFGVAYGTPPEKLRAVPDMVREAAATIGDLSITRVFFMGFGESSLNFEVVHSIGGRVLDDALAAQQELFYRLIERFAEEKIAFACPTRTLYLADAAAKSFAGASRAD